MIYKNEYKLLKIKVFIEMDQPVNRSFIFWIYFLICGTLGSMFLFLYLLGFYCTGCPEPSVWVFYVTIMSFIGIFLPVTYVRYAFDLDN